MDREDIRNFRRWHREAAIRAQGRIRHRRIMPGMI